MTAVRDEGRPRDRISKRLLRLCRMPQNDPARPALRERVIAEYMSYARYVAGRFRQRGESQEDLEQVAFVGLVKAVDNYDAAFDTAFLTYATPVISGEIKRHFRDGTWDVHVPRRMQELSAAIRTAEAELTQHMECHPTVDDLAEYLGATAEEVVEALEASRSYSTLSLDRPIAFEQGCATTLEDRLGDDDPGIDLVVDREALKPLLAELGERDKRVLLMRFFRNMSQTEIGDELGVSQMQVSRILSRIISRLRQRLGVLD